MLFSTEAEDDNTLYLGATSRTRPLIIAVNEPPPIHLLKMQLRAQARYPGTNTTTVVVYLQQETGETLWTNVQSVQLKLEDEETFVQQTFQILEKKPYSSYRFNVSTSSTSPIGITFEVHFLPEIARYQVLFAALILVGVYVLIVFELVHRTIAALFGSFVSLAVYSKLHSRPSLPEIVGWIDFDTCGLLFGMMVMVGIFSQTGFFEWIAVKAYKLSKGNVWRLVAILCFFTAFVSAFLDNVTTILLLTPVTIRLCKVLEIPPQQILIALVMFSNIGGTGTAVGDPPNIIIVNDYRLRKLGAVSFFNFTVHMAPGVLMSCVTCYFVIKWVSMPHLRREPNMNKVQEIDLWRKTAKRLKEENEEERVVKLKLEEYIQGLEQALKDSPSSPPMLDVAELERKYPIRDKKLFFNSCVILLVVIILFFLHSAVELHLSLAWIAIIGAMALLLVSGIKDIDEILEKVEFGTLLFFAGLFILMKTLEELELIEFIGLKISEWIHRVPPGQPRLAAAVTLLLWVSALVSAFIDNIPYTAAMVPVVLTLGNGDLGLPLTPLIWALAFGTCFGGNGTLIGASANVVAAGISESQGYPIRFVSFFKTGFPIMVCSVATATVYLLVFHVAIPWY